MLPTFAPSLVISTHSWGPMHRQHHRSVHWVHFRGCETTIWKFLDWPSLTSKAWPFPLAPRPTQSRLYVRLGEGHGLGSKGLPSPSGSGGGTTVWRQNKATARSGLRSLGWSWDGAKTQKPLPWATSWLWSWEHEQLSCRPDQTCSLSPCQRLH